MGFPCLTLRDNTERPDTFPIGTNNLFSQILKYFSGFEETLFR